MGRIAVVAPLVALAACNALSGLDEDFVLKTSPTVPDDAAVTNEGGIADAGADASDAEAAGDASATWCPTNAAWCEDWDERTSAWDRDETTFGTLSVEAGQGIGGSKALHAHVNDASVSRKVVRWRALGTSVPTGTRVWLTFAFRIASTSIDYGVIGALQANNTNQGRTEYGLALYEGCPGSCLDENNPSEEGLHPFLAQTTYGLDRWHRAEISVERNGGIYTGTVKVDGKPVDTNGFTYWGTPQEPSIVEVGIGAFFTSADQGTADVYVDEIAAGTSP